MSENLKGIIVQGFGSETLLKSELAETESFALANILDVFSQKDEQSKEQSVVTLLKSLDIHSLSTGEALFLRQFVEYYGERVLDLIESIDVSTLSEGSLSLIDYLFSFDDNYIPLILSKIKKIDMFVPGLGGVPIPINDGVRLFIDMVSEFGYEHEIEEKFTLELVEPSKYIQLLLSGQESAVAKKVDPFAVGHNFEHSSNEAEFREFKLSDFGEDARVAQWPSLEEQVLHIPFLLSTAKKLKGGWYSLELKKDGSTSTVFIQVLGKKMQNLVFRNGHINQDSLFAYSRSLKLLPSHLPLDRYPELIDQVSNIKENEHHKDKIFSRQGFREVYLGPSLAMIENATLPKELSEEIVRQKSYILSTLKKNRLQHGFGNHTHNGNFNVRFYLRRPVESGQSDWKYVSFDLQESLDLLKKYPEMSLTPIVVLRDWDMAEDLEKTKADLAALRASFEKSKGI